MARHLARVGEPGLAIVAVLAAAGSLALIGLMNTDRLHASILHGVPLGASAAPTSCITIAAARN